MVSIEVITSKKKTLTFLDDASGEKAPSEDCVPTSASAEGAERDAVTAAEVEEPRGDASWTMIAMWSSVLVMPILAIVAKEMFGGFAGPSPFAAPLPVVVDDPLAQ